MSLPCPACGSDRVAQALEISGDLRIVFCAECASGRQDPQPSDATLAAIYGKQYYDAWGLENSAAATQEMKRTTFRWRLERSARWVPARARVLDLGCATGAFLDAARDSGLDPYGVDISSFAIEECRKLVGPGRLFCGEFEQASFADNPEGRFDAIFMSDYLEHVRDPRGVLETASRRLAPGCAVVITTPDASSASRRWMNARWPHFKVEHLWYFSRTGLARLLRDTGFGVAAMWSTTKALSVHYARLQFDRYPHPRLTPLMRVADRLLPAVFASRPLPVRTGEVTVVAVRDP